MIEFARRHTNGEDNASERGRTVTPYLSAIPWRVSVGHTVCFTKLSVRVMCLAVLPYFFRALPVSRMHRRSSISLAPFRSIKVSGTRSRGRVGPHHNSSTYVSRGSRVSGGDPLALGSHITCLWGILRD